MRGKRDERSPYVKVMQDHQGNCSVSGCVARGRYYPQMAGHVDKETQLCVKHSKAWEELYQEALDGFPRVRAAA